MAMVNRWQMRCKRGESAQGTAETAAMVPLLEPWAGQDRPPAAEAEARWVGLPALLPAGRERQAVCEFPLCSEPSRGAGGDVLDRKPLIGPVERVLVCVGIAGTVLVFAGVVYLGYVAFVYSRFYRCLFYGACE